MTAEAARGRWPTGGGSGRRTAHFFLEWHDQAGTMNVIGSIGLGDTKGHTGMGTLNAEGFLVTELHSGFGYFFQAASGDLAREKGLRRATRRRRLPQARSAVQAGTPLRPNPANMFPGVRTALWTLLMRRPASNVERRAGRPAAVMEAKGWSAPRKDQRPSSLA